MMDELIIAALLAIARLTAPRAAPTTYTPAAITTMPVYYAPVVEPPYVYIPPGGGSPIIYPHTEDQSRELVPYNRLVVR